ncbi:lipocalin family protein [Hydrogenophaga pseudoflava]|uniref:lipocalin family protein n=1 Tax=Hydrogenophaga pseudoflava TaxID=47421 RepID=UPI0027E56D29|nr:lipocalin family protein [Hydrogenophaga pseudoflava]MDQ7744364.1 lipocalin family protein [Hydrogenophaga pseudoflava]
MAAPATTASPRSSAMRETAAGLDHRIALAEQALVARDARVRAHARRLREHLERITGPGFIARRVAGAAVAGAGLWWALRRSGHGLAALRGRAPSAGSAPTVPTWSGLLLGLMPVAWPMLPPRWRHRVSPSTAATALALLLPLLEQALSRRSARTADGPPTVARLDLARYAGTWYEQARLPTRHERACEGQPRAHYTPMRASDGPGLLVTNECCDRQGRVRQAHGVGRAVAGGGGARLQISFAPAWLRWLPGVWADLWVLHVDETASDYRVALVGSPGRDGLWLLSRTPRLAAPERQRLVNMAAALGYDIGRLVFAHPGPSG